MFNSIFQDNISHLQELPIVIFRKDSDSSSIGCQFNWHEHMEFYYVVSGGLELILNGEKTWIYAGDVAFVNWCSPHQSIKFLNQTTHYIVQIDAISLLQKSGLGFKEFLLDFTRNSEAFTTVIKNNDHINYLFRQLIETFINKEFAFELDLISLSQMIISFLLKDARKSSYYKNNNNKKEENLSLNYVRNILLFLHKNYTENIDEQALAMELGISLSYMCRIFKKHTGMTITLYINQIRCQFADSFISAGCSVSEAGLNVGYCDYNYFSRVFKKTIGRIPSKYGASKFLSSL